MSSRTSWSSIFLLAFQAETTTLPGSGQQTVVSINISIVAEILCTGDTTGMTPRTESNCGRTLDFTVLSTKHSAVTVRRFGVCECSGRLKPCNVAGPGEEGSHLASRHLQEASQEE